MAFTRVQPQAQVQMIPIYSSSIPIYASPTSKDGVVRRVSSCPRPVAITGVQPQAQVQVIQARASPTSKVEVVRRVSSMVVMPTTSAVRLQTDGNRLAASPQACTTTKAARRKGPAPHASLGSDDPPPETAQLLPALPSSWAVDYEIVPEMPVLGAGAFGTILQVRHTETGQNFACKVLHRQFLKARGIAAQIQAEIGYMHAASASCRVANLFAAVEEAGCVFLLMELCVYGSLENELSVQAAGYLPDERAARCAKHLFQGLQDIHAMGIIHRDIKIGNLLVTTGVNGPTVKLTDFGWAAATETRPADLAGTFQTMAPEILRGEAQTTAVDLWSAGAVIYQLVTGLPLVNAESSNAHEEIHTRKQRLLDEIGFLCPLNEDVRPSHVSPVCWDLLCQLLRHDVKDRVSASEALQHEWLREPQLADQGSGLPKGAPATPATSLPGTPSIRSVPSSSLSDRSES